MVVEVGVTPAELRLETVEELAVPVVPFPVVMVEVTAAVEAKLVVLEATLMVVPLWEVVAAVAMVVATAVTYRKAPDLRQLVHSRPKKRQLALVPTGPFEARGFLPVAHLKPNLAAQTEVKPFSLLETVETADPEPQT